MQSDLFIYFFKRRKFKQFLCRGKKTRKSPRSEKKKGKTPRRARGEESSSPVSEEIKVKKRGALESVFTQKHTDRSTPSPQPAPSLFPLYLPASFIQTPEEKTQERTQKKSPAVRSFFFLSTSLVSCRSCSLSENSKVSFHKKLLLRGAAQERRVGRHRPHSKKNQNKILTDADQSSLPPSSPLLSSLPLPPLSLSLSLSLSASHTRTCTLIGSKWD